LARIGILTLYVTGHLGPSLALARALEQRGHRIVVFNLLDTQGVIEAEGIRFVPYATQEYTLGSLRDLMEKTAALSGQPAFAYYVERMTTLFRAGLRDLPKALMKESVDLLVADQVYFAAGTVAEHLDVPFVSLANALLINREDVIPPPAMLWPYDDSSAGQERNSKGWAAVDQALMPLLELINRQRATWKLPSYGTLEESFSSLAQIVQQPSFLDFPRYHAPPTLHMIGPLRDDNQSADIPFAWDWLDGRPLIFASCGTLQNRQRFVFEAIIEACGLFDTQTVIALGEDALDPGSFHSVPSNVKLATFVPQRELLRRATLCITHAGLNTTLDCLEFGVPMVAVPIASEQPGIAMRIAHLGAGKVIPLSELNKATLEAAIEEVLSRPNYGSAAKSAATKMATLHPIADAVKIIQAVLP
jgi:zeaxanthin glucosyltransferase